MAPPGLSRTTRESLSRQIEALSSDLRDLSHQLHPSILEDFGLEVALRALVEGMAAAEGLEVHVEIQHFLSVRPYCAWYCSSLIFSMPQVLVLNVRCSRHPQRVRDRSQSLRLGCKAKGRQRLSPRGDQVAESVPLSSFPPWHRVH
jgi:signal transduction histidine kinase